MLRAFWPGEMPLVLHTTTPRAGFTAFDLTRDHEAAAALVADAGAVICLSGVTPARMRATGDPLSRNVDLALAALAAAHAAGGGRVFLASSAAIYGNAPGVLDEEMPCLPVSDYGRAKLEMERVAAREAAALGHPLTSLRIGNVAGADAILGNWTEGMALDHLGGGRTPARSYIGPRTFAKVMHALCQSVELPGVINLACPGTVEMGALLDVAGLPWARRDPHPGVIPEVALSTRRLSAHVPLAKDAGTAAHLVAEWRDWQERQRT